jgi:uncharacterized protein with HEPN domain
MRRESLYLTDIVEAADHIADFIAGTDFQTFQQSEMLRSAVVQKLAVIGEAAARVSEELKTRHPQAPGHRSSPSVTFLSMRIFAIDWEVVWRAAANRCPVLREQVAGILAAESGGVEDEVR